MGRPKCASICKLRLFRDGKNILNEGLLKNLELGMLYLNEGLLLQVLVGNLGEKREVPKRTRGVIGFGGVRTSMDKDRLQSRGVNH